MYKRRNRIYAVLLAGTLLGSMISGGCSRAWAKPEQEALKVTLLKVGKADAIALLTKEKAMVIDAGEEEDGGLPEAFLFIPCRNVYESTASVSGKTGSGYQGLYRLYRKRAFRR